MHDSMSTPVKKLSLQSARVLSIRTRRDGGWCVAECVVEQGPQEVRGQSLSVVGIIPGAEEDGHYELELTYARHPTFGPQWRIERAIPAMPVNAAGLSKFLRTSVPGIGKGRAKALLKQFGHGLVEILDSDDAESKLSRVAGLGKAVAKNIVTVWRQLREQMRAQVTLYDCGFSPGQVARSREVFADLLPEVVQRSPYRLMGIRGVSFTLADTVAVRSGLSADHPARLSAAAVHVLKDETFDGHCWTALAEVARQVSVLLKLESAEVLRLLSPLLHANVPRNERLFVRDRSDRCWLPHLWRAHRLVVDEAARRISDQEALHPAHTGIPPVDGLALTREQQAAVDGVVGHALVVLTGGPGTGKTTVVRSIIATCAARLREPRILLAAPTGKAARRLSESTRLPAVTVHRLLEWHEDAPKRNRDNPVEADVVIIDESSMLDLEMAAALFAALPRACRLVLVGDVDQLPSVGPGQILADMIAAGAATYRLSRVHRQAAGSLILQGAHAINHGEQPAFGSDRTQHDLFWIDETDPARCLERVVRMVADTIPQRAGITSEDIRVLAPVYRGECGIDVLNVALRERLNPASPKRAEFDLNGERIRVGDRLVWLSNDRKRELVNGTELRLVDVQREREQTSAVVETDDGRTLTLPLSELDVRLAYALSVHKSQGSEYPAIVLVLNCSAWPLLERRLLYTAITRARRLCVCVGERRALLRAIGNVESSGRRSGLAEDLSEALSADADRLQSHR
jgi:exodeoxyribonuclease V alpha subunit